MIFKDISKMVANTTSTINSQPLVLKKGRESQDFISFWQIL